MSLLLLCGYVMIMILLVQQAIGQTVTQGTEPTGTPVPSRSDASWNVIPAIIWSSLAAFVVIVIIILGICFVYKRRRITETGHQRFYNVYEREKETTRRSHKHSKKWRKSKRETSERHRNDEIREYDTLGGMRVQTVDLDNALVGPPGWDTGHSNRSDVESELFNINKINPVYDYSADNHSRQLIVADSTRNEQTGIYEPGDIVVKLHDSARDLARAPSVRGSAAASFSGLPVPSMTRAGSHVIHVKYEMTDRREEPAIYRDSKNSFRDSYIPDTYDVNQGELRTVTRDNEIHGSFKAELSNVAAPVPIRSTSGGFIVSAEVDTEQQLTGDAQRRALDDNIGSHFVQDPGLSAQPASTYISPVVGQNPAPVDGTYKTYIEPVPKPPEPVVLVPQARRSSSSSDSSHRVQDKTGTGGVGSRRFGIFKALEDLIRYHPPPQKK